MAPACPDCKTKKIQQIIHHLNSDGITTGFQLIPCGELDGRTGTVTAERVDFCIKKYHKSGGTK